MTLHYHGTPITPRADLLELAGRNFCVSYAEPRDVDVCHEIGQSVMLDNGAYTHWKQGRRPDWTGYYEWCEPWLDHWTTWAVIPDVIDGTDDDNGRLIEGWPFGERGAPVWHMHEPLERLVGLADAWPRVCIGSSGQYATLATPAWHHRMRQAMDELCDHGPPPTALHMLRGLDLLRFDYPFASADSTNIARNHAGNHTRRTPPRDVRAMADQLDAQQAPARWTPAPPQLALTA